jgi:hypothetical protein
MKRVSHQLFSLLRSLARDDETRLVALEELWAEIVGKDLARNVRPVAFNRGELTLRVGSPIWSGQVFEFQELIINSVNECWGSQLIERIRVEVSQ